MVLLQHRAVGTFAAMDGAVDVLAAAEAAVAHGLTNPTVQQLTGGYSWQTYLVSDGTGPLVVVRVAPRRGTLDPYDPDAERRALGAARGAVPAPSVLLVEADSSVYGAPLQVQTVGVGMNVRTSSVGSPAERSAYRSALALGLGRLHRDGDASQLGAVTTTGEAIQWVIEREIEHYERAAPARHPGFEIGLRWLLSNLPEGVTPPVVCHGDYRLHNVLWTAQGEIGAVLDWERAWAGDPMCDVAFTRQFSGWAAIDGDAVGLYEEASGREIDESRMEFYLRLERWRSYTASMRGLAAVASGASDQPELVAIGEAGLIGAWDLVDWLEDGLVALPENLARRPVEYVGGISLGRRVTVAESLEMDDPQRSHLLSTNRDYESLMESVDLLRALPGSRRLKEAMKVSDPEQAWINAYGLLTSEASHAGGRLRTALHALGRRFTAGPMYLREMKWR